MSNKRGRKKGVSDFVYITPSILEEVIKVAVYDVRLEVWRLADPPRKREREVR